MISIHERTRTAFIFICFCMMVTLSACKGEGDKITPPKQTSKTVMTVSPAELRSLPRVALTGTKIQENVVPDSVRVKITATGTFGANVIPKTEPERIIVIIHNATKGDAPASVDVNDGTISRMEIAQLDTGRGPAVRIIIGLSGKTDYAVAPDVNGVMIDVRKRK